MLLLHPFFIRVVPSERSHDDVGWKKTPTEYYTGSNGSDALGAVRFILDSVIVELQANPARTFMVVEQAFFYWWWGQQDEEVQSQVRALLASGQLIFVNGGTTMFDE